MANVLDEIKLDVTLWDGATDRYVKATIKSDGAEVAYSPVALVHIGLGQYYMQANDIIFPIDTQHLSIVYEVFSDNLYSVKSNQHSTTSEHYTLSDNSKVINTIDNAMNELRTVDVIVDMIEEESIQAMFDYRDTPDTIEIVIEEETEIVISVEQENEVDGTIIENDTIVNIEE